MWPGRGGSEAGRRRRNPWRIGRLSTDSSWAFDFQGWKTFPVPGLKTQQQAGLEGGGKPGGAREAPGGGGGQGEGEDGVAACCSCHRQVLN